MIWTRWTKEYLPDRNVRDKWNKDDVIQLKVTDLVWVVQEKVKQSNYRMAQVLEVQEGSDDRVRSATSATKDGPRGPCRSLVFGMSLLELRCRSLALLFL